MKLPRPLPAEITEILQTVTAPPRLVAHLTLVHEVAALLIAGLKERWPNLEYDEQGVLVGAATHDIGKALCPAELTAPGVQHEAAGYRLLVEKGVPKEYARFAYTHGQQQRQVTPEDSLVALADKVWKGQREAELELEIAKLIAAASNQENWEVYAGLDDLLTEIAQDAEARLAWQNQYPV